MFYKLVATRLRCFVRALMRFANGIYYMKIFQHPPKTTFEVYSYHPVCLVIWLSVRLPAQGKLYLGYHFWTKWDRALILHMCMFVTRPFYWYQTFLPRDLYLVFWPTFDKNLTLALTLQPREMGFSYYTYYYVCLNSTLNPKCLPRDLDNDFWPTLKKNNLCHNFGNNKR